MCHVWNMYFCMDYVKIALETLSAKTLPRVLLFCRGATILSQFSDPLGALLLGSALLIGTLWYVFLDFCGIVCRIVWLPFSISWHLDSQPYWIPCSDLGNVAVSLWGECHRWIPLTKASNQGFDIYVMVALTHCWTKMCVAGDLIRHDVQVTSRLWLCVCMCTDIHR